jgi:UTP-glucose-1-phosphate uridylyltransferase
LIMDGKRYDIGMPDNYLATLQSFRFKDWIKAKLYDTGSEYKAQKKT